MAEPARSLDQIQDLLDGAAEDLDASSSYRKAFLDAEKAKQQILQSLPAPSVLNVTKAFREAVKPLAEVHEELRKAPLEPAEQFRASMEPLQQNIRAMQKAIALHKDEVAQLARVDASLRTDVERLQKALQEFYESVEATGPTHPVEDGSPHAESGTPSP